MFQNLDTKYDTLISVWIVQEQKSQSYSTIRCTHQNQNRELRIYRFVQIRKYFFLKIYHIFGHSEYFSIFYFGWNNLSNNLRNKGLLWNIHIVNMEFYDSFWPNTFKKLNFKILCSEFYNHDCYRDLRHMYNLYVYVYIWILC